ncbi:hypothetical protein [Synechococcus sp. BA-132 BA5]|uniref:hypothetical protein n=1 Tax=Synechococcus sp. BA-132 BA5 TaxID=3110252 RepID=UPI002B1F4A54|nr:hypothetical protein [Synechococcus sp. BA-132 BA5]MEA5414521.1 hypothetical protein [Synechococcus sp. BA-132 BA5]
MASENRGLAERVEVFTRATSDALQKAVGEVLAARNPFQLLYRLSRIVLLGLVLYTAWLLITLQPDLAKRITTPQTQSLQEQVSARQPQVQTLLRNAIETNRSGLHTLALLQWNGGGSVTVLAADGRHGQLALTPGQQPLLGVEMAEALGHVALGLCSSESLQALLIGSTPVPGASADAGVALLCPVGCSSQTPDRALLLGIYGQTGPVPRPRSARSFRPEPQQEQLLLIARRLGELLDGG